MYSAVEYMCMLFINEMRRLKLKIENKQFHSVERRGGRLNDLAVLSDKGL